MENFLYNFLKVYRNFENFTNGILKISYMYNFENFTNGILLMEFENLYV